MPSLSYAQADLEANLNGRMTAAQARRLRRSIVRYEGTMIVSLVLFVLLLHFVFSGTSESVVIYCIGSFTLLPLWILVDTQRELWLDARDGEVLEASGNLWSIRHGGKGSTHYDLHMIQKTDGQLRLVKATLKDTRQFKEGSCYRVFYAPRTKILISAEEIGC